VRLLFVKTDLAWPRSSGHDVYTYYTMKACADLGHEVSLATAGEPIPQAIDGLTLTSRFRLDSAGQKPSDPLPGTRLQKRFRSFWGIPEERIAALQAAVADSHADAAIIVGLDALPYFPPLRNTQRIWFAADEWVRHHLSQIRFGDSTMVSELRSAAIKGLYERAHARSVDRAWVVSESERVAMRWLAGMRHVDVVPLGVDSDFFRPEAELVAPRTATFWGRLDFGPNVQALEWFFARVWPTVRRAAPDARFTIIGFSPGPEMEGIASHPGVTVLPNLMDLRATVRGHGLVVLPFVSGGGMKNKLLEAAALGMPIVCTPLATQGLQGLDAAPFAVSSHPDAMAASILKIWNDDAERARMAAGARDWAVTHHSWIATARHAIAALENGRNGHRSQ